MLYWWGGETLKFGIKEVQVRVKFLSKTERLEWRPSKHSYISCTCEHSLFLSLTEKSSFSNCSNLLHVYNCSLQTHMRRCATKYYFNHQAQLSHRFHIVSASYNLIASAMVYIIFQQQAVWNNFHKPSSRCFNWGPLMAVKTGSRYWYALLLWIGSPTANFPG